MRCPVLHDLRYRVAATGLAAGLLCAGSGAASVEVRGSIEAAPDAPSAEVSLVPVPPLYELLTAVLAGQAGSLYAPEATVQALDGRFRLKVGEPNVRWVKVRRARSGSRVYLLLGPETDVLLPPVAAEPDRFCTMTLETAGGAWIVGGASPPDLRFSFSSWNKWRPWRRLETGTATRYEVDRWGSGLSLTIGASGYEPAVVECGAGARVAVKLERSAAPVVEGVLRRNGAPLPAAVLVGDDGWPVGATDERGRYRAPGGIYRVLTADGGVDVVDVVGGIAELAAQAPLPVAIEMRGVGPGGGDLPLVAVAHWSSAGELLALDVGRPENRRFGVGAGPGTAKTTVSAQRFAPLEVTWSARPAAQSLDPLRLLEGVVSDRAGTGVPDAEISVHDRRNYGWLGVSDGAGRFRVEIPDRLSRLDLVARADGYREARQELGEVLSRERLRDVAVQLVPAQKIVGRLVSAHGGSVRGTVVLAEGWAMGRFLGDVATWSLEDAALLEVAETDHDGTFRLDPVDKSNLKLAAAAPGHGTIWQQLPAAVPGAPGDQDLGELVLAPEIVLRGRVMDEDGSSVPGATVELARSVPGVLLRPSGMFFSASNAPVAADADGGFRIGGLAPGDMVDLRVRAAGFVTATAPQVRVDASLEGEEVAVRLRGTGELSGRVTDEATGEGVEALLRFHQTIRGGSAGAKSEADGTFVLSDFPEGAGVLTVRASGYENIERPLGSVPRFPLELVLHRKPEIEVAGVVVRDGGPVVGASVSIRSAVSVTDATGRFRLKSYPGQATVECRVPGAARPSRRELEVVAGLGEVTIDITPVTLRGRVEGADGMPVPSADVRVWSRGQSPFRGGIGTRTGPEGDFAVQVEPGVHLLSAHKGQAESHQEELAAAAGDEPYVLLTLPAPRVLRARVLGLNAAEAAEVAVISTGSFGNGGRWSSGMRRTAASTDAEPVFETNVGRGENATVVATVRSTGRVRRRPIQIASAGVTEVEISFVASVGRIEGTVTLDGWPLVNEPVFVTDDREGTAWSVQTDHRGAFVIDGLEVGGEISVAAVGQRRAVRVTERTRVDLEARSAAVRGRLLNAETGLPAAGMWIAAVPAQSAGSTEVAQRARWVMSTRTAEDGAFVLDGLFAAPYRLEIRPPGADVSAETVVGYSDVDLSGGDRDVMLVVPSAP